MLFFLLNLIGMAETACCVSCSSSSVSGCLTCASSYYKYNSLICLPICPYTFSASGSDCISSGSNNLVFELNFYDYRDTVSRSIGNFKSRDS